MTTATIAAIYLRISDADRDDFDAIKRQYEDSLMLINRMGWTLYADAETINPDFHGAFVDHAKSASKRSVRRPAYERMIAAIGRGSIHAIIGYDLDRITRQPRQLEDLIDLAEDRGLIVKTLQSDYDLTTEDGRLHARIKATIAKNEVEQKSKRQKRSNDQRIAAAIPVPSRRPYGYENGGKSIRPSEAPVVRRIFEEAARGDKINVIARRLNADGIQMTTATARMAGKWERMTVRSIILNPRYAGLTVNISREELSTFTDFQRRKARLDRSRWMHSPVIEPIVTRELMEAAHDVVLDPSRVTAVGGGQRKYFLTGVGECPLCGSTWVARTGRRLRYRCGQNTAHPSLNLAEIEWSVALAVGFTLATRAEDVLAALGASSGVDVAALRARLAELAAEVADIMQDRAAGLLTAAESRPHLQRVKAEQTKLEAALATDHRSNVSTAVLARLATQYAAQYPAPRPGFVNVSESTATAARIASDFLALDVFDKSNVVATLFRVSTKTYLTEDGRRRPLHERIVIEDRLLA